MNSKDVSMTNEEERLLREEILYEDYYVEELYRKSLEDSSSMTTRTFSTIDELFDAIPKTLINQKTS